MLSEEDGSDYLPPGYYLLSDGEFYANSVNDYILNKADVVNTVHHSDRRRLNGCCGLDGCDGPNTVCLNGHEVGTERSDCWLPHSVGLNRSLVAKTPA